MARIGARAAATGQAGTDCACSAVRGDLRLGSGIGYGHDRSDRARKSADHAPAGAGVSGETAQNAAARDLGGVGGGAAGGEED